MIEDWGLPPPLGQRASCALRGPVLARERNGRDARSPSEAPSFTLTGTIPRALICAKHSARPAASTASSRKAPSAPRYVTVNVIASFLSFLPSHVQCLPSSIWAPGTRHETRESPKHRNRNARPHKRSGVPVSRRCLLTRASCGGRGCRHPREAEGRSSALGTDRSCCRQPATSRSKYSSQTSANPSRHQLRRASQTKSP